MSNRCHTSPIDSLTQHGIKPSVQRIAVMEYLLAHHAHPTADEIYNALTSKIPTLSKATVYNTLKLLVEHGAAAQLTIDERNAFYDSEVYPHAHFLCRRCGHVFDVPLKGTSLNDAADIGTGFRIDTASLYFRGICPECRKKEKGQHLH